MPELLSDGDSLYPIGYDTLGWQTGSDWRYVLPDALGSVRQELVLSEAEGTNAAGAVIAAREWTPYGEELALSGMGRQAKAPGSRPLWNCGTRRGFQGRRSAFRLQVLD